MSSWRPVAIAFALAISLPSTAAPENRPRVAVRFEVEDWVYQLALGQDSLPNFCQRAESVVASALAQRDGYLDFHSGAADSVELLVMLIPDSSTVSLRASNAVALRMSLNGLSSVPRPTQLSFISSTTYVDPDALLRSLALKFENASREEIEVPLLSEIPIADSCLTRVHDQGIDWVIPFSQEEMCSGLDTEFSIHVRLSDGYTVWKPRLRAVEKGYADPEGSWPSRYHYRIVARSDSVSAAELTRISQPLDQLRIEAIYVTDYVPLETCEGPSP